MTLTTAPKSWYPRPELYDPNDPNRDGLTPLDDAPARDRTKRDFERVKELRGPSAKAADYDPLAAYRAA